MKKLIPKPNSNLDANVNIESTDILQSICDPEVSSAIGNLDEVAIKESVKNT